MEHSFKYWHGAVSELSAADREVVEVARAAARQAYAPITHFGVGAAVRLRSGAVRAAHNIESPIGVQSICAERNVLLGFDPADPIEVMAVAAVSGAGAASSALGTGAAGVVAASGAGSASSAASALSAGECYPCGVCRQAMVEVQARQGAPFRVLMTGSDTATVVDDATMLLPFTYKY